MNRKNMVAKILQIYALVNAVAGAIMTFILADSLEWTIALIWFALVLVVSFFIYAIGEIIELLTEIKLNTRGAAPVVEDFELPEI